VPDDVDGALISAAVGCRPLDGVQPRHALAGTTRSDGGRALVSILYSNCCDTGLETTFGPGL
jgi:hypothetical protein